MGLRGPQPTLGDTVKRTTRLPVALDAAVSRIAAAESTSVADLERQWLEQMVALYDDRTELEASEAQSFGAQVAERQRRGGERELRWWREFALKIERGGDMPTVGAALLGHRFTVNYVDQRPPPASRITPPECATNIVVVKGRCVLCGRWLPEPEASVTVGDGIGELCHPADWSPDEGATCYERWTQGERLAR